MGKLILGTLVPVQESLDNASEILPRPECRNCGAS